MGNQLSGGEQQMLAIARALMTNPALLLLDEPLEGLAPIIVEELAEALERMMTDEGTASILVEQHTDLALSLTDDAVVIERGAIVHRGARPSSAGRRDARALRRPAHRGGGVRPRPVQDRPGGSRLMSLRLFNKSVFCSFCQNAEWVADMAHTQPLRV